MTRVAAHQAELLVHDGSFADGELERRGRDRPLDRAAGGGAGARGGGRSCLPWSTSPRATTSATFSPRPARDSRRARRRATSTSSRSRSRSAASRGWSRTAAAAKPDRARPSRSGRGQVARSRGRSRGAWSSWRKCLAGSRIGSSTPSTPSTTSQPVELRARGRARPTRSAPGRAGSARPSQQEALLLLGQLEAAHDPQEGAAAVAALEQVVVGIDLVPRDRASGSRSPAGRRAREQPKAGASSATPRPSPRIANGRIVQGRRKPTTSSSVFSTVSESTRSGLRIAHSKPIGPPMSWTTRWQRSIPSASIASPVQRARPDHE